MNKRGISGVILALLMIVLTMIAVGVVWTVIQNILSEESNKVSLEDFRIGVQIQGVRVNDNNVSVSVLRNVGKGDLTGLKFIFSDNLNSESKEIATSLKELEGKSFDFTLNELNANEIKTVSVVPIYVLQSGIEVLGEITPLGTISAGGNGFQSGSLGGGVLPTVGGGCTLNPDPCGGNICGVVNNGCGEFISCGSCSQGNICSGGICIPGECTPNLDPCGGIGYSCGNVDNGCSELTSCGACSVGFNCVSGECIEQCASDLDPCATLGYSCGIAEDGCGSQVSCGTCSVGFICSQGSCILETPVNTGNVDSTWPPGLNLFFDSPDLSKTQAYSGKFVNFPGSSETRCIYIEDHIFPSDPEIYNQSILRLDAPGGGTILIASGDSYSVWNSPTCGGA